jgi:hypothetical protein
MTININRDAVAGIVLALLGAAIALHAYLNYPVGSISRMGPGMFPVMMGSALFLVALGILAKAFVDARETIQVNVRAALFVLVGLAVFAVLVEPFGVAPALFALLVISCGAVPGRKLAGTIAFSAVATAATVVIFVYMMDLHFKLFGWPA